MTKKPHEFRVSADGENYFGNPVCFTDDHFFQLKKKQDENKALMKTILPW